MSAQPEWQPDAQVAAAWERTLARTMVSDQCWIFLGSQSGSGYGCVTLRGRSDLAHRLAYEYAYGPVPTGLVIDHTCHDPSVCVGGKCPHRLCVNPDHLTAIENADNARRQVPAFATTCKRGHAYTDLTTGRTPKGQRYCKTCRSEGAAEAARVRPERHARSLAIRKWATENGIPVSVRGRVSEPVIAAWTSAGSPGWSTT